MFRSLRPVALLLPLLLAAGASGQAFQGLDSPQQPKKKKAKKSSSSSGKSAAAKASTTTPASATKPASATVPATSTPAATPAKATGSAQDTGLDLSAAPPAQQKPKQDLPMPPPPPSKKGTAPTTTFEALDVTGRTADRQRLEAANASFNRGEYDKAALAAWELMNDPKMAPLQLESQYLLGKTLYRMGQYHAALGEFSQILARGKDTKFFGKSLEWLFFISHKTVNESVILDEVARYANADWPERYQDEFHYLLARYHFVRGRALDTVEQKAEAAKSFEEARKLTATIPRSDRFYAQAKYLEGLTWFRDGNMPQALEAMKEVVRVTRPGGDRSPGDAKVADATRDLAFMQLARIHYGARQNRFALYYYGKIERGKPQWLEALFESAWANYRIGQYEQSLGNLITLSSPFFRDEYFPEALILKAVIYYENCRYAESTAIVREFERRYKPVYDALENLTRKNMEAADYYAVLADIQKKNRAAKKAGQSPDLILERVLKLALSDKDLKNTNDSIIELENELDSERSHPSLNNTDLAKHLQDELKKQRASLIQKAGLMAKAKLEQERNELRTLLGNGERIKFETTTKEKEFLEEQLQAGGRRAIIKQYKYSVAVNDDQLYWPFQGEFWRDELGTYQYTLTKGCIERKTGNKTVSDASAPAAPK
ncbi:MAG TPA: adventurous gliding motility protein GltC [Candidatus Polarisedimenticolaceae bacterium]|nr:adventurous gliding motility protein GltC [Candidatus Polarisedimenticolaceae bacterium]